jgi:cell division protein FtsL
MMSLVTQGNLAVKTGESYRKAPERKPAQKEAAPRRSIPLGEKLAYLAAILFCMAVAGAILWQYAQIYSVNTRIQQIEREIAALEKENRLLELEAQRLQEPKRLIELGKALGFVQSEEGSAVPVSSDRQGLLQSRKIAFAE